MKRESGGRVAAGALVFFLLASGIAFAQNLISGGTPATGVSGSNTGDQTKTCAAGSAVSTLAPTTTSTCSAFAGGTGTANGTNTGDITIGTGNGLTLASQAISNGCAGAGLGSGALCTSGAQGTRFTVDAGVTFIGDVKATADVTTGTGTSGIIFPQSTAATISKLGGTDDLSVSFSGVAYQTWTYATGGIEFPYGQINLGARLVISKTAPTISSGFGSGASVASGGAIAFKVNVGTGGTASSGVVGLPATTNYWVCSSGDITTPASFVTVMTASTTNTATFTNYSRTTGLLLAWTASDILAISCVGAPN